MKKKIEKVEVEKVEKVEKKETKTSATVTWSEGVREYSKEVHGADFMELAEEFAKKKNGTIA